MRPTLLLALLALAATVLSGCASKGGGGPDESSTTSTSGSATATGTSTPTSSGSTTSTGTSAPKPNAAPAIGSFTANATSLSANVTFSASDADGDALTYTLSFGDNSTPLTGSVPAAGGNATHTYAAAGNYTLTLEVRDAKHAVNQTLRLAITAGGATAAQHEAGEFVAVSACQGFFLGDLDGVAQLHLTVDAATYGLPVVASVDGDGIAGIRVGFFAADGTNVGGAEFAPGVTEYAGTVPDGAVEARVVGCGAGPYAAAYDAGEADEAAP